MTSLRSCFSKFNLALLLLIGALAWHSRLDAASLTLSWSDNSSNESGFKVERETGTTGTYAQIATVGVNVKSYSDSTITAGTTYCYRVRAFNSGADSVYSNEICGSAPTVQSFSLTLTKAGIGVGTVTSSPTGINCGATCAANYNSGQIVTLTATPASGSTFAGWSGNADCSDGSVTMNASMSCTATFNAQQQQFTLSVSKAGAGSGTVTTSPLGINCGATCAASFNSGQVVTLAATPASGSTFAGWSGNADCSDGSVTMNSAMTCTATFNAISNLPNLSINDVSVIEGNSGTVNAVFAVTMSAASSQTVSVSFSTANDTATAGSDYVATSSVLSFSPGQTSKTISVLVNGDTVVEPNETFLVNLTSATNATIVKGQGVGTILNDDIANQENLGNVSTRGRVLTGDNAMIGGFIIEGSASMRVLVRSRGPSMGGAPFFVPGVLANPFLQLFSGQTVIAQNDNWQDAPSCSGFICEGTTAITSTGLDPCTPNPGQTGSPPNCNLESAILITLPPGAYTSVVTGADGGTGIGLVEVFDADTGTASDLSNMSTRGVVQSGDSMMIGGLIIDGSTPAKVLIRARGPSMGGAPFFVPGVLANPFLQLYSGQTVIAQNDNWQDAPTCGGFVCGGAANITATGLDPCQPNPGQSVSPPSCNLESAILITLPPGSYTAMVSGVGGGTGVGLLEVFELN